MSKSNKEIVKTFRLTTEEDELLNQLAKKHGMDPSKYLRNIIINQGRDSALITAFSLSPDPAVCESGCELLLFFSAVLFPIIPRLFLVCIS